MLTYEPYSLMDGVKIIFFFACQVPQSGSVNGGVPDSFHLVVCDTHILLTI